MIGTRPTGAHVHGLLSVATVLVALGALPVLEEIPVLPGNASPPGVTTGNQQQPFPATTSAPLTTARETKSGSPTMQPDPVQPDPVQLGPVRPSTSAMSNPSTQE